MPKKLHIFRKKWESKVTEIVVPGDITYKRQRLVTWLSIRWSAKYQILEKTYNRKYTWCINFDNSFKFPNHSSENRLPTSIPWYKDHSPGTYLPSLSNVQQTRSHVGWLILSFLKNRHTLRSRPLCFAWLKC